jgi:aryl-alcohol dehydrogenase
MVHAQAAIVEEPGAPFTVHPVTLDEPRPREVLVRMVAAGLCHTDLGVQAGGIPFKLPGVLGHEGAGVVVAAGSSVSKVRPGDRVLLSFTSCGCCAACRNGHPAYCATWVPRNLITGARDDGTATVHRDGQALGGCFFGQSSFATYALADERSVVKMAADAPLHVLAPLGCGTVTGVGAVWHVLAPAPGSTLAVFGTGAVGLAAIMAAAQLPLDGIIAVDKIPGRLDLARELGATHTVNAADQDAAAAIAGITGGRGVASSIDTTAVPAVLRTAVDALSIRGCCAVIGAPPQGTEVSFEVQSLLPGKRIVGVTLGDAEPETLIPQLAALHRAGRLPLEKLIRYYPLAGLDDAARDMREGTAIKPVIRFPEED